MPKTHKSVLDLVKDIGDSDFHKEFKSHVAERRLVKALVALRCHRGLTQTQLAKKMGVSQGKISKLEQATDKDISTRDIFGYCDTLGFSATLTFFDSKMTITQKIKQKYRELMELVFKLRALAKNDPAIQQGVDKFSMETIYNLIDGAAAISAKIKWPKKHENKLIVNDPVFEDTNVKEERIKAL